MRDEFALLWIAGGLDGTKGGRETANPSFVSKDVVTLTGEFSFDRCFVILKSFKKVS